MNQLVTKLTLAAEAVKPSGDRRKDKVRKGLNRVSIDLIKDLALEKVKSCKGEESGSAYPKEIQKTSEQRVDHGVSEPLEVLGTVDPKGETDCVINQQAPDWLEPLEEEDDDPKRISSNSYKSPRSNFALLQFGRISPKRPVSPGAVHPVLPQLSQSLLQPISPTGIQDRHKKSQPIKSSVPRQDGSTRPYHLRPVTKLPVKLSGVNVGASSQSHCGEPVDSVCSKCGGSVPGLRTSGDRLCPLCIPDKKQPPSIVFRKVGADQWVVGRPECKEEYSSRKHQRWKGEADEIAVEESPKNLELQRKFDGPKKRIQACKECEACLREDCGKCDHCLDKPKFGGQNKKKQKCRFRRCKFRPELKQYSWRSWKGKVEVDSIELPAQRRRRRMQRRTDLSDDTSDEDEEITPGKEMDTSADFRQWDVVDDDEEEDDDDDEDDVDVADHDDEVWTPEPKKEEKEDEPTPYMLLIPNPVWPHPGTRLEGCYPGDMCNVQLLKLNGRRCLPSIFGGSRLPIKTQYSDVLDTDPGMKVNFISQPSPNVYPNAKISDKQRFVDIEVDLEFESDYDSPTKIPDPRPNATGKDIPEVQSDVTSGNVSDDPLEEMSMVSLSVKYMSRLAGEVNHKDVGERDLLHLLQGLRKTVLPAHWVGVLAAGPLLQLLQCSKLSTMTDTVIQIHPGFHYQITIQGLHLLPTHTLYNTNPSRFTHLSQVVSLLLDLENMVVCQGFSVHPTTQQNQSQATQVVRAACCQLLVPHTQERCELCQEELSEEEMD